MKVLLLFFFTFPAFGLTEQEVIDSVLKNFPLVEEAVLKYEAAKEEVVSSQGNFDHKLTVKTRNRIEDKYDNSYLESTIERLTPYRGLGLIAGHRQGRGTFAPYDGKYETSGAGELFAGLSLPLLRNSSTDEFRTNLMISKLEKEQAREELQVKRNVYVHKALSLYYKWLLEKQKLKVKKDLLKLALERTKMIEGKFRAGAIERIKLTDNERSINKRKDEVLKSEIDEARARTELSLYVRDPSGLPRPLDLDIYLEESWIEKPLPVNDFATTVPQLKIIDLERKKITAMEELYRQGKLPGLSVELLGAKELSPNAAYDPYSLQIGVKLDYPLENRKAKAKTVAQEYKQKALERQRSYISSELERFFNFSLKAMLDSKKRWETISEEFKSTKLMALAEKKRWEEGASDLFIVNLREEDVANSEIKRWSALNEFLQYSLDARLYSAKLAPPL